MLKIVIIIQLLGIYLQLGCLNDKNEQVDFITIIKKPNGMSFLDYNPQDQELEFHHHSLHELQLKSSSLRRTLDQLDSSMDIIAWNDQPPIKISIRHAHSKGVLMYDPISDSGFVIVHSVPYFPTFDQQENINSTINDSQTKYGQTLICMSMDGYNLDLFTKGLEIEDTTNYFKRVKTTKYENLFRLGNQSREQYLERKKQFEQNKMIDLQVGTFKFLSIFKNPLFKVDIYEDVISELFQQNILVESWGRPYLPSQCVKEYQVKNVETIDFDNDNIPDWRDTQDHSKWAVTENPKSACVGGINHMNSQKIRGGSIFCLNDFNYWKAFRSLINQVEECEI